jgi:hypothetical protein
MGAVGLVFAPLAPLVVLAAAIVFWMSSWVYKYQLMFVFISKVESGGVSPIIIFLWSEWRLICLLAHLECRHQSPFVLCRIDADADGPQ